MPRSSGRRRSAGAESGGGNGEDSSARNGRRRPTRTETAGLLHAGQTLSVRASVHTHTPTPRKLTATPTRPGLPDENTSWEARGMGHTHGGQKECGRLRTANRAKTRPWPVPSTWTTDPCGPRLRAQQKRRSETRPKRRPDNRPRDLTVSGPALRNPPNLQAEEVSTGAGAAQRQTSSEDGNDVDCAKQEQ